MSNSSKIDSISQIIENLADFDTILKNAKTYHAHRKEGFESETLKEHIFLVNKKLAQLTLVHELDLVIDNLIEHYVKTNFEVKTVFLASQFIKKLFVNTIVFHDYGKINPNFQVDKMKNKLFKSDRNSVLSSHHSSFGAYFFILCHFQEFSEKQNEFSDKERMILYYSILLFSYPIFKHHSKTLSNNAEEKIHFDTKELEKMQSFLKEYNFEISDFPKKIISQLKIIFARYNELKSEDNQENLRENFPLYALLKLNFSLLTASDYLATGEYMNGLKLEKKEDFGVLERSEIDKIYEFLKGEKRVEDKNDYNQITYRNLDKTDFGNLTDANNGNLNKLRQKMAIEVINKVRQNSTKNLFYIEAPTGGGKTNLSMLAAMELLKANQELNKVFYVFPFTTLVTQTYKSIIKTLGLDENQIVQLHSKAGITGKESDEDAGEEDADYGNEKKNYIDNLFVNFPFCLMTHIKFFDILKTNEKETNYILHRLANSVVVIDELQAYNPKHWDKLIYIIQQYAHFFNIRFIIMSATLPKLSKIDVLQEQLKNNADNFVYLLENAKTDYFQNENFRGRVSFNFDLLEDKEFDLEKLANQVIEKSKNYAQKDFGKAKPKDSIYTIVEFIFKKSATQFKAIIENQELFFDEIFVLSGTILEHRRKQIINSLKNKTNRNKKILLITTQVVEAGVDIDMDLGFKNRSLIDSDEQLAGRINRNVNKENCTLYLFEMDDAKVLYKDDLRFQVINKDKKITENELKTILDTKNFDSLYNLVFDKIDTKNKDEFTKNFTDYKKYFQNLEFTHTHTKFKLIEQKNLSIFVPIDIPVQVENEKGEKLDEVFSKEEIKFLRKVGIEPNKEEKIEGEKVFDLYLDLIENKDKDFLKQKLNFKILQGVMSKFIFSVFGGDKTQKLMDNVTDHKKSKYGINYLENTDVYDEFSGLDETKVKDSVDDFI